MTALPKDLSKLYKLMVDNSSSWRIFDNDEDDETCDECTHFGSHDIFGKVNQKMIARSVASAWVNPMKFISDQKRISFIVLIEKMLLDPKMNLSSAQETIFENFSKVTTPNLSAIKEALARDNAHNLTPDPWMKIVPERISDETVIVTVVKKKSTKSLFLQPLTYDDFKEILNKK